MKLKKAKHLAASGVKPYKLNKSLQEVGFKLYDTRKGSSGKNRKKSKARKTKSKSN